jgi:hypothetical protein
MLAILLEAAPFKHSNDNATKMFHTIFEVLKATIQHWVSRKGLKHVTYIMCVLALRFGKLKDIGDTLLNMTKERSVQQTEDQHILDLEVFYEFLLGKKIDVKFFNIFTRPFEKLIDALYCL